MRHLFNPILNKIRENNIPYELIPVGVGLLALGILIPWLGFYQDDWHHVYYFLHEGPSGLQRFLFFDSRPFSYPVYIFLFDLFGATPIYWHLYVLAVRITISLVLFKILSLIWPDLRKSHMVISALFLVYPVFLLQSMAVMFSLHWTMLLTYMISLWAMLLANKSSGKKHILLTVFALVLQAFHLIMIEYFIGLEFLRPVLLFFYFKSHPITDRFFITIKQSLPYVLLAAFYVVFRASFSSLLGYDRNSPEVLLTFFQTPLQTINFLIESWLQDFAEIFISAWYATINPSLFDLNRPSVIVIWGIVVIVTIALGWLFKHLNDSKDDKKNPTNDHIEILTVGFITTLLGILPGWMIGRTIYTSNPLWNDRFAMAALFGAAMVCVSAATLIIAGRKRRDVFLALLIALAVGANLRAGIEFKQAWEKETLFYWQLYWRAPNITPNTAFISDSEFLSYMGNYPTGFAINTLYPKQTMPGHLDYWLFSSGENVGAWDDFRSGTTLGSTKYASRFSSSSKDIIALTFEPQQQQCLWLLSPDNLNFKTLPLMTYEFLPNSNLDQIYQDQTSTWNPRPEIFGEEPAPTWCYFYQKAALAQQYHDWLEISTLWKQAQEQGFGPKNTMEYLPFIEAFARLGEWELAQQMTIRANTLSEKARHPLCSLWDRLKNETSDTNDKKLAALQVEDKLNCYP